MSEPKWTKGEWIYRWDGHVSARCPQTYEHEDFSLTTELRPICQCSVEAGVASVTEEDEANAHLIASAPSLFEVLAKIERDWDGEPEDMEEARAALRKARGEKP